MLILHGSATGTAVDVAANLYRLARRYQVPDLEISSLENMDLVRLIESEVAIFVVSTTGNGEIPRSMLDFWSTLLRQDLGSTLLDHLNFVILGLGDSKYLQFNWTAKKLRRRLLQLGAHELMDVVMCDDSANNGQDEALVPFNTTYQDLLRQLNGGQEPIGSKVLLPPIEPVQLFKHKQDRPQDRLSQALDSLEVSTGARFQLSSLRKSTQLTPPSFAPTVRLFDFQLQSKLEVLPGDVLSIVPSNSEDSVSRFLALLDWQAEAETQVLVPRNSKVKAFLVDLPCPTLRQLVSRVTPLHGVPSLSFFTQLRPFATNEDFREKFEEWETSEGKDDLYDYLTRPRRTLLEILEDFSGGIKVPVEHCLDLFGVIVPRDYSIAGAHRDVQSASADSPSSQYCIQLLVALVKYQTKIKEPRQGQASRFLASYPVTETSGDEDNSSGSPLELQPTLVEIKKPKVSSVKMPIPTRATPLLLLCTGTGLAPLRYLLQYLWSRRSDNREDLNVTIFFGCRSHNDDLVELTLTSEIRQAIHIHHAYSRLSGQKKTYVQDALRTNSEKVNRILDADGIVYLCGSSGAMPDAVRAAIDDMHGAGTVESLESSGRWWQETW